MMAQSQLPGVTVDRRVTDLAGTQQSQAAADLIGAVVLLQASDQLHAHRFGQMRSSAGSMTAAFGVTVGDRGDVPLAGTVAP